MPFRKRRGNFVRKALYLLIGAIVIVAAYAGYLCLTNNFHIVVADELYRSAQPTETQIAEYKTGYGIQTIINLRGENSGSPWYDKEVETAKKLGIELINFRMSAKEDLTHEQVSALIHILENAKKPILVHCMHGADRSGLAAAFYLAAVAHQGERAAERQLSIRFGHIGIPHLFSAYAMDRTFEKMEPTLGFSGS